MPRRIEADSTCYSSAQRRAVGNRFEGYEPSAVPKAGNAAFIGGYAPQKSRFADAWRAQHEDRSLPLAEQIGED
jgi:hypothetical protein